MNKGLKNYTKQLTQEIGNVQVSVNINKNDANLIISAPLIETNGVSQFNTSFIYNYQKRDVMGLLGYGTYLNYYGKIVEYSSLKFGIINADQTEDLYLEENEFYNEETGLTLTKTYDDEYEINYHIKVEDKQGNYREYSSSNLEYPSLIVMKNGDRFVLDFTSSTKTISNNKGDVIKIYESGPDDFYIEYLHNDESVLASGIRHFDYLLDELYTHKSGISTKMSSVSFGLLEDKVVVHDNFSDYRIEYTLVDNRVVSFRDGYDDEFTNGNVVNITYEDKKTTITYKFGHKSYVYFDGDDFPLFEIDDEGNVVETEYNKDTKALISKSSVIQTKYKLPNLLSSEDLSSIATNSNVSVTSASSMDNIFSDFLSSSVKRYSTTSGGYLTINVDSNVLSMDNISLILWGRQLSTYDDSNYVEVQLILDYKQTIKKKFNKTTLDFNFDLITLGLSAEKSYTSIQVKIVFVGSVSIELGGIQLLRKEFGSFYNYDSNGDVSEVGSSGNKMNISYNSSHLPSSSIGFDSTKYDYKYDDYGNLTQVKTAYGVKINNVYDTTYPTNLIKNTISNSTFKEMLKIEKTYTDDGRFVKTIKDEGDNITTFDSYDSLGNLLKATSPLNVISEYEYFDNGLLKKILLSKDTNSSKVNYSYDSKNRIETITLDNGSIYTFIYDTYDNLISLKMNGVTMFSYVYDNNHNLIEQHYGADNGYYKFNYDEEGNLLKNIIYVDENNYESLRFSYEYDELKRLVSIKNSNDNELSKYEYDNDSNIISVQGPNSLAGYRYDNLGNVNNKVITVNNKKIYQSFDTVERSKGDNPESLMFSNIYDYGYFGSFIEDANIYKETTGIQAINLTNGTTYFTIGSDGIIPSKTLESSNPLSYVLQTNIGGEETGNVKFWFKPTSSQTCCIFSIHSSGSDAIVVNLEADGTVYVDVVDYDGYRYRIITSTTKVTFGEWNFFALTFMNRDDSNGIDSVCEYALNINGVTTHFKQTNPRIYCSFGSNAFYNIGHLLTSNVSSNNMIGKIACLSIGPRTYCQLKSIDKYYRMTKDYLMDNKYIDSEMQTVDFSQTTLYSNNETIHNLFDIYPLHNSVTSLKGNKPVTFDLRTVSTTDKDRTFNYNSLIKRYAYVADGNKLIYDFDISASGTIMMKVFSDVTRERQYFFEIKDNNGNTLGLFKDLNNKIYLDYNNSTYPTSLYFVNNSWNTIGLSFTGAVEPDSLGNSYFNIRVYVNGSTIENTGLKVFDSASTTISIGQKHNYIDTLTNLGGTKEYYPLYGQIEMLVASKSYCELSTLTSLVSEMKCITKLNEFSDLGMLKKIDLHEDGSSILSNSLTYKSNPNSSSYITKNVSKESIKLLNEEIAIREYTIDANGNVTSINDSKFGSHTYKYDYRGFLEKEDNIEFQYDKNGNITKNGDRVYLYDSTIKDRLKSVDGKEITYYSNNPGCPRTYDGNTYYFEGRRLVALDTNDNKSIYYTYDDQGLRINKEIEDLITGNIVNIDYIYEGGKLITEIHPDYRLDFLYDENNELYGFIYNDKKYYYVRDILKNILGIVSKEEGLVVQYEYTAYGELKSISGTLASTIGVINPFRYKGYYFDSETQLYWVSSRYYSPELCRWISPDSIEYLDPQSINGLNLYAYCGNDPINRFDPTGHSWESFWNGIGDWFSDHWKEVVIGTAFIVGGALVTALTAGAGVGFMAAFGSALLSSTIQVGISVGTSVLVGGLVSVANGGGFFDNVGDNIASAYMWGGIFSGGAQILGGGFRIAANKGVTTGRAGGIKLGNSGVKILSPDKNNWAKAGGTLIKFGNGFRIDTGAMWGLHMHILSSGHLPIGAVIAGFIGTEY